MVLIRLSTICVLSLLLVGISPGTSSATYAFNEINELPVAEILADLRTVAANKKKFGRPITRSVVKVGTFNPKRLNGLLSFFRVKNSLYSFRAKGHRLSNGIVAPLIL